MIPLGQELRDATSLQITMLMCLALALGGCGSCESKTGSSSFSSDAWKKASGENAPARRSMAQNLIRDKHLSGMTKQDVVDLLGNPDITGRYNKTEPDVDLNYSLGPETGYISIDTEWLTVKFRDGKVSEVLLTRD